MQAYTCTYARPASTHRSRHKALLPVSSSSTQRGGKRRGAALASVVKAVAAQIRLHPGASQVAPLWLHAASQLARVWRCITVVSTSSGVAPMPTLPQQLHSLSLVVAQSSWSPFFCQMCNMCCSINSTAAVAHGHWRFSAAAKHVEPPKRHALLQHTICTGAAVCGSALSHMHAFAEAVSPASQHRKFWGTRAAMHWLLFFAARFICCCLIMVLTTPP